MKIDRGCEFDSPIPGRWKYKDINFRRCPNKIVTEEASEYLRAYDLLEMGFLPHGPGWLTESPKFIDAMRVIRAEVVDIRNENARKQRRS